MKSNITPEEQANLIEEYSEYGALKWFILCNPTYGSWDSILSDPKSDYLKDSNGSNNLD